MSEIISEKFNFLKNKLTNKNAVIGSKIEIKKANNGHGKGL